MRFGRTLTALGLVLALVLPAQAAQSAPQRAQRQEDLDALYTTLEQRHPDLFANTPQEVFLARRAEIEATLDQTDDVTFGLDLQSLVALAGDSHTTMTLTQVLTQYSMIPVGLKWMEGRWVLSTVDEQYGGCLGWTVTAVNGFSMDEVQQRLSKLLSADNHVKLRRQVAQIFGVEDFFVYCGLARRGEAWMLSLAGPEGQARELTVPLVSSADQAAWPPLVRLSALRTGQAQTDYNKERCYFSLPLDENNYYIQYNVCREDPELPMSQFAAQVEQELAAGGYRRVMIDLRNNGGGSDGVLQPLLALLAPKIRSGQLEVWGLIGEATFSSAGINAMMIREMGGCLAGEESGGSVDHFGEVGSFTLPNSGYRVSFSQKYIALSDYLECAHGLGVTPIRPDLPLSQSVADYLAGTDTLVEALKTRTQPFAAPEQPDAPLTRGRFAELLRQAVQSAGMDTAAPASSFYDCFPFAWFAPGVDWAADRGVISGAGEGLFRPSLPITRQEAAVMLAKCAALLGREQSGELPSFSDGDQLAPWAVSQARQAVSLGLMTAENGAFHPQATLTRAQGEAIAARLAGL